MKVLFLLFSALFFFLPSPGAAPPSVGIGLDLARRRARSVSRVRYRLSFSLAPGMKEVEGKVEITFELSGSLPSLALDFRGKDLRKVSLQGRPLERIPAAGGHLVLPGKLLRPGRNTFSASFSSPVAPSGTPLTVYRDRSDSREYYYTLLVPADAHRLFPCFDQPDLKGRFLLELRAPEGWTCVANSAEAGPPSPQKGGFLLHRFRETPPLSTYLFAFAAGPFASRSGPPAGPGLPPMRVFFRPSLEARLEAPLLFRLHRECLELYGKLFRIPYPFEKLDFVLVPGFPYGGMEHAGAVFYREKALWFDHPPTARERTRRKTVVYHEVSHQWFGDLVTMRWFDDLWLKEGFANLMSYFAMAELGEGRKAWTLFHRDLTVRALRADKSRGTTPVYQPLRNLDDAKSNYGPIVYDKAPAVLKSLLSGCGEETFFKGIHRFLSRFAWRNAGYRDLLGCLEEAGAGNLERWAAWWLSTPGVPRVRPRLRLNGGGRILALDLLQESPQGWWEGGWPSSPKVLLAYPGGRKILLQGTLEGPVGAFPGAEGLPAPRWILPCPGDETYGLFLPDLSGAARLMEDLPSEKDPLLRSRGFYALKDLLEEGEISPGNFLEFSLRMLKRETDPSAFAGVLSSLSEVLEGFLPPRDRGGWRERCAAEARFLLVDRRRRAVALPLVRFLLRSGRDLELAGMLTAREIPLPWLQPGRKDLFLAAAALGAAGKWKEADLERFAASFRKEDVAKYLFMARAALPSARVKERYFRSYLAPEGPPEQWVSDSLAWFHWPGQEVLTLPFLERALAKLEWVKAHRKIFFLPRWIDAFVNGHSSRAALEEVRAFLGRRRLPEDVRLKLLLSLDRLERAVEIQGRWGGETQNP